MLYIGQGRAPRFAGRAPASNKKLRLHSKKKKKKKKKKKHRNHHQQHQAQYPFLLPSDPVSTATPLDLLQVSQASSLLTRAAQGDLAGPGAAAAWSFAGRADLDQVAPRNTPAFFQGHLDWASTAPATAFNFAAQSAEDESFRSRLEDQTLAATSWPETAVVDFPLEQPQAASARAFSSFTQEQACTRYDTSACCLMKLIPGLVGL
jgi:hypothetical protein